MIPVSLIGVLDRIMIHEAWFVRLSMTDRFNHTAGLQKECPEDEDDQDEVDKVKDNMTISHDHDDR